MITDDLTLNNYISGGVFKYGIDSAFGDIPAEGSERTQFVFLVLFNSDEKDKEKKIVISSKSLTLNENGNDGDITLISDNSEGGAILLISEIAKEDTKNYLTDYSMPASIADGFAFIRCNATLETEAEIRKLPDFTDAKAKVILKGKLSNKPIFSEASVVTIDPFKINFGVAI